MKASLGVQPNPTESLSRLFRQGMTEIFRAKTARIQCSHHIR